MNRRDFIKTIGVTGWPGKVPAGESGKAISLYDMMPTFAELAGVNLRWPTDGVSIVPLLTGKPEAQTPRPALFFPDEGSFRRWRDSDKDNPFDAVLLDDRYYAYSTVATAESENPAIRTFDLSVDPGCREDLAGARPELAAGLTKRALQVFSGE